MSEPTKLRVTEQQIKKYIQGKSWRYKVFNLIGEHICVIASYAGGHSVGIGDTKAQAMYNAIPCDRRRQDFILMYDQNSG